MLAWRELHVHLRIAFAKVNPRCGFGDLGPRRQTVGVDTDVMVAHSRACRGHLAGGYGRNLEIFNAEFQVDRALDSRAIGGLHEEYPAGRCRSRPSWCGS